MVRSSKGLRRHWPAILAFAIASLFVGGVATAQVFQEFVIDPARSHVAFSSGDVSARLGLATFPFASLTAQPGTGPVPVTGHFVAAITPDFTTPGDVSIVQGTTDVRPLHGVLASPGLDAAPGSAPAAVGLAFDDPSSGVSGEIALRDLVFALGGSWQVMSNGAGPQGLFGEIPWIQAQGTYDLDTSLGLEESVPIGAVPVSNAFLSSSTSQLSEVSPGVHELILPYTFTLYSFSVPGPVSDLAVQATFSGELVATTDVPEPGATLGLMAGAGVLAALRRTRGRR